MKPFIDMHIAYDLYKNRDMPKHTHAYLYLQVNIHTVILILQEQASGVSGS